jgi:D-alanyl-lipoteichoic acid acyltransferase DltB (MBOAT superfamily)
VNLELNPADRSAGVAGAIPQPGTPGAFIRCWRELAQLGLAVAVVYAFSIEGVAFRSLFALAAVGFVVNLALPLQYRLPFFVILSVGGAALTLGVADAAWLIGAGLVLIALSHLPASGRIRVTAIVAAGLVLAAARAGLFGVPWSSAVWPVLGSMFMFRLALYVHATSFGGAKGAVQGRGWLSTLAYFFMLPNLVFPLFPVVDFQTFVRTHYDRDEKTIYEQGMLWVTRGLVHLLLYRFVYQRLLLDPAEVASLGDLVQFMLSTFLLYLRVSGQFHLIVGILHLFGFRLPETHKLYYLAHSFTELWRRINIYWTEFMMKLVFYPTYFRVKKLGPTRALVVSTAAVFVTTWILHSYQWFWLRGGFPMTPQDVFFWGALGALVIVGAVRESKAVRRVKKKEAWSARLGARAALTFASFCFLWSLWSTESVVQWMWTLGAAANVDVRGVVLIVGVLLGVWLLGGGEWTSLVTAGEGRSRWLHGLQQPAVRTTLMLVLLLVSALPAVRAAAPPVIAAGLQTLHETGLNARDAAIQHRGYYEQLEVRATPNALMANTGGAHANWTEIVSLGVLRERRDLMVNDLEPSRSVIWNGHPFSTNRWGMRDKDYEREKPAATLRIALLGPSHVMGDNVNDGHTFEAIVEDRLNREFHLGDFRHFELMNFAMPGFSLIQQIAMLDERALAFQPDVVILTHHGSNRELMERCLQTVIWSHYPVSYEPLQQMINQAGLGRVGRGGVPVPFDLFRTVAGWAGIETRMPHGESAIRTRQVVTPAIEWAFHRFADQTKARGAVPVVLALNVVVDHVPNEIPNRATIDALHLPVLDLFDVYPLDRVASLRVAPWDDHPNDEAHRLIADRFYPELTQLLSALPAETWRRASSGTGPAVGAPQRPETQ